jgi:glycine cleavage system H lipoate-binding protein
MFLDNFNSKYNRYKINKQPQGDRGWVTVLLNLSNDDNFEVVLLHTANRAHKLALPVRGLILDLNNDLSDEMAAELSEKLKSGLEKNGFRGEIQLDVENQSFHKLLDSYFNDSALVICDSGFSNADKRWRHYLAKTIDCEMVRVEKRRSKNVFNMDKVIKGVSSEKISLTDLILWINKEEDLYFA